MKNMLTKDATLTARLQRKEREFKQHPAPTHYIPRLTGPSSEWKVFYKPQDAFQLARSNSEDLHVFSYESKAFSSCHGNGQRMFLVASYDKFWHFYRQLGMKQRHHYEIIPEGSVCHLYFDLEFSMVDNPSHNGAHMTQLLIKYVCAQLKSRFGVQCNSSNVVQLVASTEKKFSRHLVFHILEAVFKDNVEAGCFVQEIFSSFLDGHIETCQTNSEATPSSTATTSKTTPFCEATNNEATPSSKATTSEATPFAGHNPKNMCSIHSCSSSESVHSPSDCKNCIERQKPSIAGAKRHSSGASRTDSDRVDDMVGHTCQKYGKWDGKEDAENGGRTWSGELTEEFLTSAGLSIDDLKTLFVKNTDGRNVLFVDLGVYTKYRNFRLYLSSKLGKENPLILADDNQYVAQIPRGVKGRSREEQLFLDSLVSNIQYSDKLKILTCEHGDRESSGPTRYSTGVADIDKDRQGGTASDSTEGYQSSPYPDVDRFITSTITKGGVQGHIRRWVYFSQGALLIYDISRNRWCANVGRPHKSNNIMMWADLSKGVYYQKCHDPECRAVQFKSPELPLPKDILPPTPIKEDGDFFSMMDEDDDITDDDLVMAANQAESNLDVTCSDEELFEAAAEMENEQLVIA